MEGKLPSRSTRGKRFSELLGEEAEQDAMFWNQDFFQDLEQDDEYSTESDKGDKFDDDFFDSESEQSEEPEEKPQRKSNKQTKQRRKQPQKTQQKQKSKQKQKAPRSRSRSQIPQTVLSQRQLLEEAAINEMYNTFQLSQMLRFEEDSKRNHAISNTKNLEDSYKIVDSIRSGDRVITISGQIPQIPSNNEIAAKGKKYKDPLSGQGYDTLSEFKELREQIFDKMEENILQHCRKLKNSIKKYCNS